MTSIVEPEKQSLLRFRGPHPALGYLVAAGGAVVLSAALVPLRDDVTPLSKGLGFLLVVVAAAAIGGLWPGVAASVLGFMVFNYLFIPPYGTPAISQLEDLVVLLVFLGLSVLISALLARARQLGVLAELRGGELELLHSLSGAALEIHSGQQSYQEVIQGVVGEFGFERGSLFVYEPGGLTEKVTVGAEPGILTPAWEPATSGRSERLPLLLGGKAVGVLVLWMEEGPPLTRAQSRILRSFCDQLAVVLEVEQLKRIETDVSELLTTDAQRKALLVAVSHELSGPLAAINATVADLLSGGATRDFDAVRESLYGIYAETERLSGLVTNLLDMSRIEGGLLEPRIQAVSLEEVIADAVERFRSNHPKLKVYVSAYESDMVQADPEFLDRVVVNLLDNAAAASEATGSERIEVLVTQEGEYEKVAVVDHGEGVPYEGREQLFYPFYKLEERQSRYGPGLGLAIVKGFISLMDGDLWVEDTAGGGATIVFSLPAAGGKEDGTDTIDQG